MIGSDEAEGKRGPAREVLVRSGPFLSTMVAVGIATVVAKGATLGREVVLARSFGASPELDAYYVALAIPLLGVNVIGSSLGAVLVPRYIELRGSSDPRRAQSLAEQATLAAMYLNAALLVVLVVGGPPGLRSVLGASPETVRMTAALLVVLAPLVLFLGVAHVWTMVLAAEGSFAPAALVPAISPLTVVAVILASGGTDIVHVALAAALGGGLELLLVGLLVYREGLRPFPRTLRIARSTRRFLKPFPALAVAAAAMSATMVIDNIMASGIAEGSVAVLNLANRLPSLVTGVASLAIGNAILPHLSGLVHERDWGELRRTMRALAITLLAITAPAALLLIALSGPIVDIVFAGGELDEDAALLVARAQALYLLQIPSFVVSIVGVRVLTAMSMTGSIALVGGANLVLNVVLNVVLSARMGAPGIALSTSLVYFFSAIVVIAVAVRRINTAERGSSEFGARRRITS